MKRKRIFGVVASLLLAGPGLAMLVAEEARADITLSATGQVQGAVTFAKETLASAAGDTRVANDTAHYRVTGAATGSDNSLTVIGTTGVGVTAGDSLLLEVMLHGMLFGQELATVTVAGGTVQRVSGGTIGESSASFSVSGSLADTAAVTIELGNVFIPADGTGSVSYRASTEVGGTIIEETTNFPSAVRVAPALMETATPMSQTAQVSDLFRSFKPAMGTGKMYVAQLGSLSIVARGGATDADNYQAAADAAAVSTLAQIMAVTTAPAAANNVVSVAGDFSFVETVEWQMDDSTVDPPKVGCSTAPTAGGTAEARMPVTDANGVVQRDAEGNTIYSGTQLAGKRAGDFEAAPVYLCIYVDDEDEDLRIPESSYTATITYTKLATSAFGPMSTGPHSLGRIMRDGAMVHIPYLTTAPSRIQRIIMTNRGSVDAPYEFSFRPDQGTMAAAGAGAMGTLGAGETMTLNTSDVVELSGDFRRTAATVSFQAQMQHIDLATTITNMETGAQSVETHSKN